MRLSVATLSSLPAEVAGPAYDHTGLTAGILHFGVGNFHRAHQAVYLDDLFCTGRDHDWALVGAGVLPGDEKARQVLADQDFLTTVVAQETNQSEARVTASMVDFLGPNDPAAITRHLVDPTIRIASLTITEGGYCIDPATGVFDPNHPAIATDAADPEHPASVFGHIVLALRRRRAAGTPPFTVMSCDNVPHNGVVARNAVVGLARLIDPELAGWIEGTVAFPNGMVDRITPATGDRERRLVIEAHGIEDAWPVFCEGFRQWVLEDTFPAGRPALEAVGVEFVPDVTPYETMKIRVLNGGHAVIAYPAALLGIEFAHEAMGHPLVRGFLEKVERDEIIPVVPPVPNTDLDAYFSRIVERFANPKIADTTRRLCADGSNRQPKFILPSIAERLRQGLDATGLALESALWCRYCAGMTDAGGAIEPNASDWDRLRQAALAARETPEIWMDLRDVYGEIGQSEILRARFAKALSSLWQDGVEATLARYIEGRLATS